MDSKDKKDGVAGSAAPETEAQVPADVAAAVAAMLAEAQAKSQAMVDDAAAKAQKLIADAEALAVKQAQKVLAEAQDTAAKGAQQLLADARADVAQQLAEAAKTGETQAAAYVPQQGDMSGPDPEAEKRAKRMAYLNEKVPVRLMKDNGRYKDDVFIAVNGKGYLIKRGVQVMVPRFVDMALAAARSQDERTDMLIAGEGEKFSRAAREM